MFFSIIAEDTPSNQLSHYVKEYITEQFCPLPNFQDFFITHETLKPCIGCFQCWLKIPGQCCIKDLNQSINSHLVNDDVVIFISSIPYGSYGVPIKNVFDRSIPNVLPFFKLIKKEVHHARRYKKLAKHIVIAYDECLSSREKETFTALTKANSINFGIPEPTIYFCQTTEDIRQAFVAIQETLIKEGPIHA